MTTRDVVTVHGLWMPGLEMTLLRNRLNADGGFNARQFRYHSVTGNLDHAIECLRAFIVDRYDNPVHIVAHSLGGVLSLQMLKLHPDTPVERVVCLGSPLVDSRPVRHYLDRAWARAALGRTLIEGVIERPLGEWSGPQEVGVIAGTQPFGSAMYLPNMPKPHDGVVATVETQLPGIADYVEVPLTHAALLMSRRVVRHARTFLCDGRFSDV